jgi:hypothetical protein
MQIGRKSLLLFALGTALGASGVGCHHDPDSWGGSTASLSGMARTNHKRATKRSFYVEQLTHNGAVYLLMCVSGCSGGSEAPTTLAHLRAVHGYLHMQEGRPLDWMCKTEDGSQGEFTIKDHKFDITQGRVFLIRSVGGKAGVRQVDVDLSDVQSGTEVDLHKLAQKNADIAAFFKTNGVTP